MIRLKLNRKVRINGKKLSVTELCTKYKGRYATRVIYHGRSTKAKLTAVKGCLSGSSQPLAIILIFGLSDHPMVLATNLSTDTKNHLMTAMRLYFSRLRKYGHALYVGNTDVNLSAPGKTKLNYQFLNTLALTEEEFEGLVNEHMERAKTIGPRRLLEESRQPDHKRRQQDQQLSAGRQSRRRLILF